MMDNTAQPNPIPTAIPAVPEETITSQIPTSETFIPQNSSPISPMNSGDNISKSKPRISGKLIATLFAVLFLVVTTGIGIVLVRQQQNFGQKAGSGIVYCSNGASCDTNNSMRCCPEGCKAAWEPCGGGSGGSTSGGGGTSGGGSTAACWCTGTQADCNFGGVPGNWSGGEGYCNTNFHCCTQGSTGGTSGSGGAVTNVCTSGNTACTNKTFGSFVDTGSGGCYCNQTSGNSCSCDPGGSNTATTTCPSGQIYCGVSTANGGTPAGCYANAGCTCGSIQAGTCVLAEWKGTGTTTDTGGTTTGGTGTGTGTGTTSSTSTCTVSYEGDCFVLSGSCGDVPVQHFTGSSCPTTANAGAVTHPGAGRYCTNPSSGCEQVDYQKNLNLPGGGVCKCAGGTTSTTPPNTTTSDTASCSNIKAYDTNWSPLSITQLTALTPDSKVRFTVMGTTSGGNFDKARFTINGVAGPEVTTVNPNTPGEFYYEYTIPAGVTSFTVTAQIHHQQLDTWN